MQLDTKRRPDWERDAYLTHEVHDDGNGRDIEFVGPEALRLRAARTRITAVRVYRLFTMLFEGRYDELSAFELALVAEIHGRDPSAYGKVRRLWIEEDDDGPTMEDYAVAVTTATTGTILMGEAARSVASHVALERRKDCWAALARSARGTSSRLASSRSCASPRRSATRSRPRGRRRRSSRAASSSSDPDPGEGEPPGALRGAPGGRAATHPRGFSGRRADGGVVTAILEAALSYAERGWRVLPVRPLGDGSGATSKRPSLTAWQKLAATDSATIRRWWAEMPDSGVGIATGGKSRLLVVDVDPRAGGDDALADLQAAEGPLPATVECVSGGNGRHLYFTSPTLLGNGTGTLPKGIDIRGDGGFVVAAPTLHESGETYRWAAGLGPDDLSVAPVPGWLIERIESKPVARTPRRRKRAAAESGVPVPAGRRNATLTRRAGAMRRAGWSAAAIRAALEAENVAVCRPTLPIAEVAHISDSAAKWLPPWISDPVAFIDDPRLDSAARFVLWGLVQYSNHAGETFVGCRGLGDALHLDKKTVARRLALLAKIGRIEVVSSARNKTVRRIKPFSPRSLSAFPEGEEAPKGSYVPPEGTQRGEEAAA